MARRGYKVKAKPNPNSGNDFLENHFHAPFKGLFGKDFDYEIWHNNHRRGLSGNGKSDVEKAMVEWKNGARAIVHVSWADGSGGHVFIAENHNGTIHYYDPQNGNDNVSSYFDRVISGKTTVTRVDNLELTEYINDCAEKIE